MANVPESTVKLAAVLVMAVLLPLAAWGVVEDRAHVQEDVKIAKAEATEAKSKAVEIEKTVVVQGVRNSRG